MDNIKEYIVKYKPNRIPIVTGLQQWDYGQHLIIQGIPLDELYETNVYFCFADSLKCFPSKNGIFEENEINVQIPKFIFQKQIDNCCDKEYKAYAFIYLKNGEYGKTIYKIALEIEIMPKPDEYEYDEEKLYFEELTSMLELKADGLKYINNVLYLLAGNKTISSVTIKSGGGNGTGTDGREIELQNNGIYIQWRYVGDEEWINLVALLDLKGTDGYSPVAKVKRTEENSVYIKIIDETGITEAFVYDGENGITPHIADNGNWFLGEEDTNIKAQGTDGRGIKSVEKTSSTGNIDTYTMTFTDNTTFTYNVVNASSDSGGIVAETDPTVPSWAKQPTKPSYTAQEVGALPNTTKIPVNTSDLNNDNEFITKTVTDLVNYYTKSQSYSKDEIDNKLSAIPKFSIQPVEQLPTLNISETTVYLLKTGDETNNLYTEYIYVDGKWEYLGKQTIDLSGYALKTEIPTKLSSLTNDAGFITNTVSNLVNYYLKSETYSKSEIDAKGFITEHQDLSDYAKKSEVPKNLSQLSQDSTHRVVTDSQVETWNNKSNFSGNYNDLTNKPTIPSKTSQLTNDSNFAKTEDIPTELPASDVYSWAKQPQKPTYSASEVGALPSTTKIPDKTSDLTNDSGFITKAVNDLANYYLKSQTYSAEEIDNKISTIPKFSIEVVESLPTTNISNTTVYLIASGNEQDNLYTEYIYVNGKWEYLGKQTVDLSGYVKRTELSSYYTKIEIDSLLETIRSSIPTKLSQMTADATHRTVSDTEKQTWNNKSDFSGKYSDLTGKPTIPSKMSELEHDVEIGIDDDLTILCDYTFSPENCKILHLSENNLVNDVFVKAVRSIPVIIRLRNIEWGEVVDADCILADGEDGTLLVSFNVSTYPNGEKFIVTVKMRGDELNNGYTGTLSNVTVEEHATKESVSKLDEDLIIWCEYPFSVETCKTLFTTDDGYNNVLTVRDKLLNGESVNIVLKNADYGEEAKAVHTYADGGMLYVCFMCVDTEYDEVFYVNTWFYGEAVKDNYVGYVSNAVTDKVTPLSYAKGKFSKLEEQIVDLKALLVDGDEVAY